MNSDIVHIKNPLTGSAYCGHPEGKFTDHPTEATCNVCLENYDGDTTKMAAGPTIPHSER
jgi:hypothetical protein